MPIACRWRAVSISTADGCSCGHLWPCYSANYQPGRRLVGLVDQLARQQIPALATTRRTSSLEHPPVRTRIEVLARRVAELHLALARRTGNGLRTGTGAGAGQCSAGPHDRDSRCTRTTLAAGTARGSWAHTCERTRGRVIEGPGPYSIIDRVQDA
jgi:hypothetical protein